MKSCLGFFVFLSHRCSCADTVLSPNASPAADSDEETAAGSRSSPAESRAAAARTDHRTAEGNVSNNTLELESSLNPSTNLTSALFMLCLQIGTQQVTVQAAQPAQQQKVTYAATTQLQPGIKPQFFTSITQAQKPTGAQQIQVCPQWQQS